MHPMDHMAGPQSSWEYFVVAGAVVILAWVVYLGKKYFVWPGEQEPGHIKRKILEADDLSIPPGEGRQHPTVLLPFKPDEHANASK